MHLLADLQRMPHPISILIGYWTSTGLMQTQHENC